MARGWRGQVRAGSGAAVLTGELLLELPHEGGRLLLLLRLLQALPGELQPTEQRESARRRHGLDRPRQTPPHSLQRASRTRAEVPGQRAHALPQPGAHRADTEVPGSRKSPLQTATGHLFEDS